MIKKILVVSIAFSFLLLAHPTVEALYRGGSGQLCHVPQPRLFEPSSDEVDLRGIETMEFEWSPHVGDRIKREYYDFRIYKGYDMLASGLIYKERLRDSKYGHGVPSDLFENGTVYTWSLRQVYRHAGKSARSIRSFRVIK